MELPWKGEGLLERVTEVLRLPLGETEGVPSAQEAVEDTLSVGEAELLGDSVPERVSLTVPLALRVNAAEPVHLADSLDCTLPVGLALRVPLRHADTLPVPSAASEAVAGAESVREGVTVPVGETVLVPPTWPASGRALPGLVLTVEVMVLDTVLQGVAEVERLAWLEAEPVRVTAALEADTVEVGEGEPEVPPELVVLTEGLLDTEAVLQLVEEAVEQMEGLPVPQALAEAVKLRLTDPQPMMVALGQLLKERVEKEVGVLVTETVAELLMEKVAEELADWEAVVVEEAASVPAVLGVEGAGCPLATQARQASSARGRARGGAAAPRGRARPPSCSARCQGQLGAASQELLRRQRPSRAPRHSSSARRRPGGREKAPPPKGGLAGGWAASTDRAALRAARGARLGWGWEDSQDRGASALPTSRARARPQCMGKQHTQVGR